MMTEIMLASIFEQAQQIYQLYDNGEIEAAKTKTLEVEAKRSTFTTDQERVICGGYIAPCLVDIGHAVKDKNMVQRGTDYFREWSEKAADPNELSSAYYNLANGHFTLWKFDAEKLIKDAIDHDNHRLARHFYREAINHLKPHHFEKGLACELWTNYGNALDVIGRTAEAISAYDVALRVNPNMGMALGNKGVAITYLAPLMYGHTHLFYLEALALLEKSLAQNVTQEARAGFSRKLEHLKEFLEKHGEMKPEKISGIAPSSDFHKFLCDFSARHGLYLNPVSFLSAHDQTFFGDPMFISTMFAKIEDDNKFDRYVTFLNEIKQDYILARYFLAQSQFETDDLSSVDEGVSLFYPLDYSLQSVYIQMLKAANVQAIAVLDKIAFFIYDYCNLKTPPPNQVSFSNIWGGNEKIRHDLNDFASPPLFALFALARDLSRQGDWYSIYEYRNALTHRFLVLHDMQISRQTNADIPRAQLDTFINNTIMTLKIARSAVMYLILFVEHQENATRSDKNGITMPIFGTPIEGIFRHRPGRYNPSAR